MSQEGVGAEKPNSFFQASQTICDPSEWTGVGHWRFSGARTCQGPQTASLDAASTVLILMGDWCASGHEGDTETNEDPGANRGPNGRARKKSRGL